MIDFRIETFLTVCKYMNYTRAAEALHITQPAVSQQIKYLEDFYNAKLFTHSGRKIVLTAAGEVLLHAAQTMQNDQVKLQEKISDTKTTHSSINFGSTMTIAEFVLAPKLSNFLKKHPKADIRMIMGNTHELISKLRSGEINFAIVEGYFEYNDFECMLFKSEPYIPVCSSKRQFEIEPSSLNDLLNEELLLREDGSGTREILERHLNVYNLTVQSFSRIIEIGSMPTLVQLIRDDCGISFLYKAAVESELAKGTIRELHLQNFSISHDFTFIWNKGSIFSDEYIKICKQLMI